MKTKKYALYLGLWLLGILMGVMLTLILDPYPLPGWVPLNYPKMTPVSWHTETEYQVANAEDSIAEEVAMARWYCGYLQGCRGVGFDYAGDPGCDSHACFEATGLLHGQMVRAQVNLSGTQVMVSQGPDSTTELDELTIRHFSEAWPFLMLIVSGWLMAFLKNPLGEREKRLRDWAGVLYGLALLFGIGTFIPAAADNLWSTFRLVAWGLLGVAALSAYVTAMTLSVMVARSSPPRAPGSRETAPG